MINEMLSSGIRYNHSSFTSSVVLVKKKDNLWLMCLDYRELNKDIVKDGFSIPIIDDLIDVLNGAN